MKILKQKTDDNLNYLGYDEDHNGDWGDFFQCPNKKCNKGYRYTYITTEMQVCPICGVSLEWVS